tara:strand:- start:2638 stop:3447 length:810 start_codon:yes stop_codon:yes gene_type:complete
LRDLREIRVLEKEHRNLFESIADAVFIGDPDTGQILQANSQAAELTGYPLGELIGQDFSKVHSLTWEMVREDLSSSDEQTLAGIEIELVGWDEQRVPVEMPIGIVARDEDQFYIETLIKISKRRELETHMSEMREEWDSFKRHGPEPLSIVHDPPILQRALANLLKNALEHDDGEVLVEVIPHGEEVEVRVTNGGEPIPPDRLATIFEKFNTTKRANKGTGLGTTIARLFVEAHDGTIDVTSSASEGTTFAFRIPVAGPDLTLSESEDL